MLPILWWGLRHIPRGFIMALGPTFPIKVAHACSWVVFSVCLRKLGIPRLLLLSVSKMVYNILHLWSCVYWKIHFSIQKPPMSIVNGPFSMLGYLWDLWTTSLRFLEALGSVYKIMPSRHEEGHLCIWNVLHCTVIFLRYWTKSYCSTLDLIFIWKPFLNTRTLC